jgi:hypothetical protein
MLFMTKTISIHIPGKKLSRKTTLLFLLHARKYGNKETCTSSLTTNLEYTVGPEKDGSKSVLQSRRNQLQPGSQREGVDVFPY